MVKSEFQPMIDLGNSALAHFGLAEKGWKFEINRRTSAVGLCSHHKKTIYLSEHFLLETPAESLWNTILHEIAHALVGPGHKHNQVWRNKAREIGCTGDRCSMNSVSTAAHNYEVDCENCGPKVFTRQKNKLKPHHRCGKCHTGKLTVRKVA